ARLIGHDVGHDTAFEKLPMHLGGIIEQGNGSWFLCVDGGPCLSDRIVHVLRRDIDLFQLQAPLDTPWIDLDEDTYAAVKRHRLRLGSAHLAKPRCKHHLSTQIAPAMLP